MRLTPDSQIFTALSREAPSRDNSRRRENDAASFSRQASINEAYARSAAPAKTVTPVAKQMAAAETAPRGPADLGSSRREAPMAGRPKFIPKGQTINVLI
jgi:hypothetical protein